MYSLAGTVQGLITLGDRCVAFRARQETIIGSAQDRHLILKGFLVAVAFIAARLPVIADALAAILCVVRGLSHLVQVERVVQEFHRGIPLHYIIQAYGLR
jgi:hypothetical protein